MKYPLIVLSLFFLASCSATWESEFIMAAPIGDALDVEIYDWETELYGGPSFGEVRPKIYAYKLGKGYCFIYPREISKSGSIGPPLIPLGLGIPELKNNTEILFGLRIFDPSDSYEIIPTKMSIYNKAIIQNSCNLVKLSKDPIGVEYKCSEVKTITGSHPTKIVVEFNNEKIIELPLKHVKLSGYSPIFSFNGPSPKPKVVIHEKSSSITYPE